MEYLKVECNKLLEKMKNKTNIPSSSLNKNIDKEKRKENLDSLVLNGGGDQDTPINDRNSNNIPQLESNQLPLEGDQVLNDSSKINLSNEPIDWDQYPLPDDGFWERRIDKKTGKVKINNSFNFFKNNNSYLFI